MKASRMFGSWVMPALEVVLSGELAAFRALKALLKAILFKVQKVGGQIID